MISEESVYRIGRLGRPHGTRGEITFYFDDDAFDRTDADYLVLEINGILVPFFFEEYRFKGAETALVKFEGIDSKERASTLTGSLVYFPRDTETDADSDGEIRIARLVGYTIYDNVSGKTLAPIESIDNSTMNPLFCLADGTLIPICEDWITDVSMDERKLCMTLPEGLLTSNC